MFPVSEVAVFTTVLTNEVFVLPAGARTIDLNNTSEVDAYYKGNTTKGGKDSMFVSLQGGVAYSFGDVGKPYPELVIDARGSVVELSANY